MTTIRSANKADIGPMASMLRRLAEQHAGYDGARFLVPADAVAVCKEWLRRMENDGRVAVLVAEADGVITGCLVAETFATEPQYCSGPHTYVHDIFVGGESRRRGVARALINAVAQWSRDRGIAQLRAAVAVPNGPSRDFFEVVGFRPTMTEVTLDI
jgi:L-amino acid N-acyltransferase YncA